MSETNDLVVPEEVVLEKFSSEDLPKQCKPSEATWIVTTDMLYYPQVMYYKDENDARIVYASEIQYAEKQGPDNPQNINSIVIACIREKTTLLDHPGD